MHALYLDIIIHSLEPVVMIQASVGMLLLLLKVGNITRAYYMEGELAKEKLLHLPN